MPGAIGERCSGHAPDHDVVPHGARRGARYRQRLGETAGLLSNLILTYR